MGVGGVWEELLTNIQEAKKKKKDGFDYIKTNDFFLKAKNTINKDIRQMTKWGKYW